VAINSTVNAKRIITPAVKIAQANSGMRLNDIPGARSFSTVTTISIPR
jgi:hypothetical protein